MSAAPNLYLGARIDKTRELASLLIRMAQALGKGSPVRVALQQFVCRPEVNFEGLCGRGRTVLPAVLQAYVSLIAEALAVVLKDDPEIQQKYGAWELMPSTNREVWCLRPLVFPEEIAWEQCSLLA